MLRRALLLMILASALSFVAACEKKCAVPKGTYETTYSNIEGDCPEDVAKNFDGRKETVEVTDAACRDFLTSVDGKTEGGCDMTMEVSAEARETGIHGGQAVLTIRCDAPEKYVCRHRFAVEYAKVP